MSTQMAKMLDVLEAFLNLHGHTYMRLDGSTKPEARQVGVTGAGGWGVVGWVRWWVGMWVGQSSREADCRCHQGGRGELCMGS